MGRPSEPITPSLCWWGRTISELQEMMDVMFQVVINGDIRKGLGEALGSSLPP